MRRTIGICVILAVVAVAIAPAVTESIESAQKRICAQNLGVLGRAFSLYLADYGRYPLEGDFTGGAFTSGYPQLRYGWIGYDGQWSPNGAGFLYNNPPEPWPWRVNPSKGSLWSYTDQRNETYMCPADMHAIDPSSTYASGKRGGFGLSYSVNDNVFYSQYGDTSPPHYLASNPPYSPQIPAVYADFLAPSQTVLLTEQWPGATSPRWKDYTTTGPLFCGSFLWWQCVTTIRHSGGGNFLFIDGHVGWVQADQQRSLVYYRDGKQLAYYMVSYMCPATPSSQ